MVSRIVLLMVFVFDAIAFALAVAAEQRRTKATIVPTFALEVSDEHYIGSYCKYNSDIATSFGVASLVFLFASQVMLMVASRCLCFGRGLRPGTSRTWAIVLFIICWVTFIIAEICLLAGSVRNAYHTKYGSMIASDLSCETLRRGVFAAAAAFIVVTGILSEVYYVNYAKSSSYTMQPAMETGIRMGDL